MKPHKFLIMLLSFVQQPYTSGNISLSDVSSMIGAHPYAIGATVATVAATIYGLNWLIKKHHDRYVLDPHLLPAPDKDAKYIVLFAHGAFDASKQALQMLRTDGDAPYLVEENLVTFNFDDSFALSRIPTWCFKGCLGQDADIALIHAQIEQIKRDYPQLEGIILIGISRGASAIVNYLGTYGADKIAACVLESPFDSIESVFDTRIQRAGVPSALSPWVKRFLQCITAGRYTADGIQPIALINNLAMDIPTLIVAVESDHAVPYASTRAVCTKMRERAAEHTYMLTLQGGRHGALIKGADGARYQHIAHAFFKQYNLPHNPAFATLGADEFASLA
jgi:pimeloyl-ACP methyl ester carboxylesterase